MKELEDLPPLPPSQRLAEAIFASYEATPQSPRAHLGASMIGELCTRKLWYSFRWAQPPSFSGRMLRLFETGQLEEPRIIRNLREIGAEVWDVDPATGKQFHVEAHQGHFAGSADGVALGLPDAPKTPHLLEFKTSSAKNFAEMFKKGVKDAQPKHFAQMQIYMHLLGLTRAQYIVVCKDTDDIYTERIEHQPEFAEALLARAGAIIFGDAPARISDDPSYYQCKFCDFHETCHGTTPAVKTCRSCQHALPVSTEPGAKWGCLLHMKMPLNLAEQMAGCPGHTYLPGMTGKPPATPEPPQPGMHLGQRLAEARPEPPTPLPEPAVVVENPSGAPLTPALAEAVDGITAAVESMPGDPPAAPGIGDITEEALFAIVAGNTAHANVIKGRINRALKYREVATWAELPAKFRNETVAQAQEMVAKLKEKMKP